MDSKEIISNITNKNEHIITEYNKHFITISDNNSIIVNLPYTITEDKLYIVHNNNIIIFTYKGDDLEYVNHVEYDTENISNIHVYYNKEKDSIILIYYDHNNGGNIKLLECSYTNNNSSPIKFNVRMVINKSNSSLMNSCYDVSNNKIIITYVDEDNHNVGVIKVVDLNSNNYLNVTNYIKYSSDSVKEHNVICDKYGNFVIAYTTDNNVGKIIMGTMYNNFLLLNEPIMFSDSNTDSLNLIYDDISNKFIIVFRKNRCGTINTYSVNNNNVKFNDSIKFTNMEIYELSVRYINGVGDEYNEDNMSKIVVSYKEYGIDKNVVKYFDILAYNKMT